MAILSVAEIMAAEDVTTQEVPVEEWGGSVMCRSISHRTMRNIKEKVRKNNSDDEIHEDEIEKWVFIEGMVEPKITEEEYEHLLDKSTSAINKILKAIMGSTKADDKAVKEQEKSIPD